MQPQTMLRSHTVELYGVDLYVMRLMVSLEFVENVLHITRYANNFWTCTLLAFFRELYSFPSIQLSRGIA